MRTANEGRTGRWRAGCVIGALAVLTVACDTNVTNPGPVEDAFLNRPESQSAVVNGMARGLADAINWIAYTGAAVAREIHPSGSTGSFGITVKNQRGELTIDESSTHWDNAQRARWLAEQGIARIEALPAADQNKNLLAQAYLWAGYANRLLGENMCEAVINGGGRQPNSVYFDRALDNFNKAAQTGTGNVATAAAAGRASVKVHMGDWTGAVQDAGTVPDGFVYRMPFWDIGDQAQANRIYFASAAEPYKAHTVWSTWIQDYGKSTRVPDGDPRVPFRVTSETGDAAIDCCGNVPWWPQTKHNNEDAPIDLSSGGEMRLIEAENLLRGGSVEGAITKINAVRAAAGAELIPTNLTENEAWSMLKRERAIELWLEGRRLGDLRRWNENNTPGALQPLEQVSGDTGSGSHLTTRDHCFPIPDSERQTNPNIPLSG